MSGITLVFTICSVIIAGAHFALVNGEAAPERLVKTDPLNPGLPVSLNFGEWGKCYSCKGCDEVDSSTKNTSCPFYMNSLPGCVTYSGTDLRDPNSKPMVFRDCANTLGTCKEIGKKTIGFKILSCTECFTELCNYN